MSLEFAGAATPLGPTDIADLAARLRIDPAAIEAVCEIESSGSGFLPDKRPRILFESHLFHSLTGGRYDRTHPGISTPTWVHNYGAAGAHQYDRLAEAISLDRIAALESASWGRFQIIGSNYTACNFGSVEGFVADMMLGEKSQLDAFAAFCRHGNLVRFLAAKNWTAFARGYNGPGQVDAYAADLAQAYARHARSAPATLPANKGRLPGRAVPARDEAEDLNAAELGRLGA